MTSKIFTLALLLFIVSMIRAQTFSEKISKSFQFEKKSNANAVMIYNINGNVEIEGTTGDQISVEIIKTITAKTQARLDEGKSDIQLGVIDRADTMIFYIKGTGAEFTNFSKGKNRNEGWRYRWENQGQDNHRDERHSYDYTMHFKVKIPMNAHALGSTINDGDVLITNTRGDVDAHNINGDIVIKQISGKTMANTINGNVTIDYFKNPIADCRYYSLNGEVRVNFPSTVSATMTFKSFNGELYSNFESLESLPALVNKSETQKGIKFKVDNQRYKIRSGGPLLDVETFNGDAFMKEPVK